MKPHLFTFILSLAFYSDRLVGLSGSPDQIQATAKKYRIYYSKGPKDIDGDYIVCSL